MGIYPTTKITDKKFNLETGEETWIETYNNYSGQTKHRNVTASAWIPDERTNCYCCSCNEFGGGDPYCRNHGFAGLRPCEEHNMPGSFDPEWANKMPDSVQTERARNEELDRNYGSEDDL